MLIRHRLNANAAVAKKEQVDRNGKLFLPVSCYRLLYAFFDMPGKITAIALPQFRELPMVFRDATTTEIPLLIKVSISHASTLAVFSALDDKI